MTTEYEYHNFEAGLHYPGLVVSGVIFENGKALMAQRGLNSTLGAGKWEFPGGKVELGERMESAITRELWEELGIVVVANKLLTVTQVIRDKGLGHDRNAHWVNPVFECSIVEGQPTIWEPQKCIGIRWADLSRLNEDDLTASAKDTLKSLQGKY